MAVLQELIDSPAGGWLATVLHSLGAIGFLAGLVAYLAWYRHLQHGNPHPKQLLFARFATYVSIILNLVGGFMRTWQTGHPSLTEAAHDPWAAAVLVKHMFLFAAMGAAVILLERVAPRLIRAGPTKRAPADHVLGTWVVVVGVVVAAVLGAYSQTIDLSPAPPMPDHDEHEAFVVYHNASGQLTSTPATPRVQTGTFIVPAQADLLEATLAWTPSQFDLELRLVAPDGAEPETSREAGRMVVSLQVPAAGVWSYEISSDLALDASWQLSVRMPVGRADAEVFLAERFTIPGGSFFEINTEMEEGAKFSWDWLVVEGTAVEFNVHSHFDGQVQYLVEETAAAHNGTYTNDRAGGYSLMWENTGTVPITLQYRVWGDFVVDSYFPPR